MSKLLFKKLKDNHADLLNFILVFVILNTLMFFYKHGLTTNIFSIDILIIWALAAVGLLLSGINRISIPKSTFFTLLWVGLFYLFYYLSPHYSKAMTVSIFLTISGLYVLFLYLKRVQLLSRYIPLVYALLFALFVQLYIAFAQAVSYNWNSLRITGWFYNSGIFGNYLAGTIPLLLAGCLLIKTKQRYLILILLIASTTVLILTVARAAILGTLSGCALVIILSIKPKYRKPALMFTVLLCGLGVLLSSPIKPRSATGRLTIYEVCVRVIQDNWTFGVGPGRFSAVYNNYQAEYFKTEGTSIERQLAADNTYEAFNLILQTLVEYGVLGFIVIAMFIYLFVKQQKIIPTAANGNWHQKGSLGCVMSIFVCSFFSNPFHVTPILAIFTLYLATVCQIRNNNDSSNKSNVLTRIVLMVSCMAIVYCCYRKFRAENSWYKASELSKYNDYASAKKYYVQAYPILKTDGRFLFNYGAEAFLAKDSILARDLLEKSRNYASSNDLYMYLGDYYFAAGDFTTAEKHYLHAAFMVPSHLFPKYKLVKLYARWEKTIEREFWRKKALMFPIKIRSSLTDDLLYELRR